MASAFSFVLMNTRGDRIPQDPMEMVTDSFEDLGIEVIMKWGERQGNVLNTGEWDAMLGAGHNTVPFGFEIGTGAGHVVPLTGGPNNLWFGYWANDWARWFVSNGEVGEEPPELMKQIVATYRKLQVSEDPAEMRVLAKEIFDIAHENLWVIGYVSDPGMGFVASNNMGNIGDSPIPALPGWPEHTAGRPVLLQELRASRHLALSGRVHFHGPCRSVGDEVLVEWLHRGREPLEHLPLHPVGSRSSCLRWPPPCARGRGCPESWG